MIHFFHVWRYLSGKSSEIHLIMPYANRQLVPVYSPTLAKITNKQVKTTVCSVLKGDYI